MSPDAGTAQALFVKPMLLVLDEPTNHLDLGACVWLEDYLAKWESILLLTSHSQDFLNGVCSKTYHLTVDKRLVLCAPAPPCTPGVGRAPAWCGRGVSGSGRGHALRAVRRRRFDFARRCALQTAATSTTT